MVSSSSIKVSARSLAGAVHEKLVEAATAEKTRDAPADQEEFAHEYSGLDLVVVARFVVVLLEF